MRERMPPLAPARTWRARSAGTSRARAYSTVTAFARLRGLSTSVPRFRAEW
jgi:hypothetical protein